MKILIIGEYSAFAKYLSIGLKQLGHSPFVFSWGDGFKSVNQVCDSYYVDVRPYYIGKTRIKGSSRIRRFISGVKLKRFVSHMSHDWDVAFIVNFGFMRSNRNIFNPCLSIRQLQSLLKNKNQIFLSACGGDYVFYSYYLLKKFRKICSYEYDKANAFVSESTKNNYMKYLPYVKMVIPIAIEYYKAYNYYQSQYGYSLGPVIPLPFDVYNTPASNQTQKEKFVVMHGINRYYAKGSDYIIPAIKRLENKYPNLVEARILKHLPLSEYLRQMQQADIVIDNCYGDSNSMNAVEALSMGKVVLAGNEPGHTSYFGETIDSPVIDIWPNVDSIFLELEKLVLNPQLMKELSKKSRDYACKVHDCKIIADKYIKCFSR